MPQLKKEDYVVAAVVLVISVLGISSFYTLRDAFQATQYRKNLPTHIETDVRESARLEKFLNSTLKVCAVGDSLAELRFGDFVIGGKPSNFTDEAWKAYQSSYVERVKKHLNSFHPCEQDSIFVKHGTLKPVDKPHDPSIIFSGEGEMTTNAGDSVSFEGFFRLEMQFSLRSGSPDDMIISKWSFKDSLPKKANASY